MTRERILAGTWALAVTALLAGAIAAGSRSLADFDAALVGYTFATLFAAFGITWRHAMWLQRPPTRLYWVRGWAAFLQPGRLLSNGRALLSRLVFNFALNRHIFRRGRQRGAAHMLIMWGCIMAFGITFPLVFGWLHFETPSDVQHAYRIVVVGIPTISFGVESWFAFILFHGLVWSAFLVIAGVTLAAHRRLADHGAAALQAFGEDFLPLILLFAISVTGLMLTASYTWMKGYAYDFLAILHALVVILFLLWMPFGKLFHIIQRPAQLGVSFYKDVGVAHQANCTRCHKPYAPQQQIDDLIKVERQLGYRYELESPSPALDDATHWQQVCPACRRSLLVLAQGQRWQHTDSADHPEHQHG
ncbi:MAG: MFS transporter [Planctomycetota bacterium]